MRIALLTIPPFLASTLIAGICPGYNYGIGAQHLVYDSSGAEYHQCLSIQVLESVLPLLI